MPLRSPYFEPVPVGRFEIEASLPTGLHALVARCTRAEPCEDIPRCQDCIAERFFQRVCRGLPLEDIRRIDDRVALLCGLGGYRRARKDMDPIYDTQPWEFWVSTGFRAAAAPRRRAPAEKPGA